MNPAPQLSVIIPAYDRVEPLRLTLRCALEAARPLDAEILVVDDGSSPPLSERLAHEIAAHPRLRILRQPNQGSIVARQTGLAAARGAYVQFIDSDDLVHPEKFTREIALLEQGAGDIAYSDIASYRLDASGAPVFFPAETVPATGDAVDFLLRLQPLPHNPLYRRDWLVSRLLPPLFPPDRRQDPAGDVWLYYNLLGAEARILKLDLPLCAIGQHDEDRYSRCWERIGVASLLIAEDFMRATKDRREFDAVRRSVAATALQAWRRLPVDFHPGYDRRLLEIWRAAPAPARAVGLGRFRILAACVGVERAARWLRRLRNHRYATCRTLDDPALNALMASASR